MANKHPDYWKLRALALGLQKTQLEAEVAVRQAQLQVREALQAAGLDPAVTYTMNDAEESLTAQVTP
jgi:hypothetical protein